jgi:nickel-type superoxide dismutase maturation protease
MEPTLYPGDWLLVRRTSRVRPGRVIVARHPSRPTLLLVKRAVRSDPGGWWLGSDNLNGFASDSRSFGLVPPAMIEGVVLFRYRRARH